VGYADGLPDPMNKRVRLPAVPVANILYNVPLIGLVCSKSNECVLPTNVFKNDTAADVFPFEITFNLEY
jgi:hypothetical protein